MADDDSWDDWADGWDDDPAARAYSRAAYDSLVEEIARRGRSLDGLRVLDFGCGTGLLTEQLVDRAASIVAVDIAPKMLAVLDAKIGDRRWSTVTTASDVPTDRTWDLIVCSSVLSFVDDHPATVQRLASSLAIGGTLVHWDWEAVPPDDHGLARDVVERALVDAGLIDVDVRTGFSIPFEDQRMEPLMGSGLRWG